MLKNIGIRTRRIYYSISRIQRILKTQGLVRKYFRGTPCYNVILVTIECFRFDCLKCTPFLLNADRIGALFTRAYTASPWTAPSVTSILTGLYPSQHGARLYTRIRNLDKMPVMDLTSSLKIKSIIPTIPEILFTLSKYRTYFDSGGILFAEISVGELFSQINTCSKNDIINQMEKLKRILGRGSNSSRGKFFVHIHVGDTHDPLNIEGGDDYERFKDVVTLSELKRINPLNEDYNDYRRRRLEIYCRILSRVDRNIQTLYKYLVENDLDDETIMVVTSDHGEELWDHYRLEKDHFYDPRNAYGLGHGHNMFEEIVRIPLVIMGPSIQNGVYDHPVSLIDLYVTLLDLLNIRYDEDILEGYNLFEAQDRNRLILVEDTIYGYDKLALISGKYKYIISPYDNVYWEFNLYKDPLERKPIIVDKKYVIKELGLNKRTLFKCNTKTLYINNHTAVSHIMGLN